MRLWTFLLLCTCVLSGADSGSGPLRSDSPLVLIHATVVDSKGAVVTSLPVSRFDVSDENSPVAISHFVLEDAPVSTVVLVDVSRSMRFDFELVVAAVRKFVDSREPGDEFCVVPFASRIEAECSFTDDPDTAAVSLAKRRPQGDTALLDSLAAAFLKSNGARNSRRAVLVLTDSVDNASRTGWTQARSLAQEFNGTIYAIAPPLADAEDVGDEKRLQSLVELTGGRMVRLRRMGELTTTLDSLELRRRYVIGYGVPPSARDGRYHHVSIKLQPKGTSENLRVYWRRGYRAPLK